MRQWEKIFFDLDNTLFSHEYAFERAIQDCYQDLVEAWEAKGLVFPYVPMEDWFDVFKYYSDYFWGPYERKEYTQQEYRRKRFIQTMEHFQLPCSVEEADIFHKKYYEQATQYVQPYPGLYPLMEYLQTRNIALGVITNGKTEVQEAKYKKLRLYRYIARERFIVSEEVGMEKPSRAIFDYALQGSTAENALFIGDTWEHDVVGALEAGWNAIFLNTQKRARTTEHEPLAEFSQLIQLISFFQDKGQ